MKLTHKQRRIFPLIQRKYPVSKEFLNLNVVAISNFFCHALCPRLVIKPIAVRKQKTQRVFLRYYHLRRAVFDKSQKRRIKARKRSAQMWSRAVVCYLKSTYGIEEFVESVYDNNRTEVVRVNAHSREDPEEGKEQKESKAEEPEVATERMASDEVSKQLREQLALLKSGKRKMTLIDGIDDKEFRRAGDSSKIATDGETDSTINTVEVAEVIEVSVLQGREAKVSDPERIDDIDASEILELAAQKTDLAIESSHHNINIEQGREEAAIGADMDINKTKLNVITVATVEPESNTGDSKKTSTEAPQATTKVDKTKTNFLDMLMNKVRVRNFSELLQMPPLETMPPPSPREEHDISFSSGTKDSVVHNASSDHENDHSHSTDSCEEFLGFEDIADRIPGMLQTPIVPCREKSKAGGASSAFISESLNEYMRANNLLETPDCKNTAEADISAGPRHRQAGNLDGLVTPGCKAPLMQMPAVPESLQRLRTVAERRQFLQRFTKNHKMAIINNEATVYRELQRKKLQHKAKSVAQQLAQAPNSQMPFTRNGWRAASFCATEFNKYYYQTLSVDHGSECVKLPGVRGNNEERNKRAYTSRAHAELECSPRCADTLAWRDFKPVKTYAHKSKLNRTPLPAVFRPCPLSYKPLQRPMDDDTAALLLAGGSMAVVRMPTVELQVYPELGKPLHEIAKRYLQYILPHHDISREWAEFSVSTLQQPAVRTMSEAAEEAAAAAVVALGRRKSFTFAIPYLNDRQHILVRRVVDRSEKLDQSFEQPPEESSSCVVSMADLSFRSQLDESDELLMECADVLGDMINSVAISCSENSFIKEDPHSLYADKKTEVVKSTKAAPIPARELSEKAEGKQASTSASVQTAQHKKQNRLLCELRRLNATIIDAAVKSEKEVKPCSKDFCALGCVCTSLADDYPLRQHCGKSKCVIECTCKGLNQSRIMRLETDGRSITTEDAFMLRRKATARLARMEKEFTSTIVLTENETLLINESQYDKKRRCTKAPKRYEDFADTDDDFLRTPPKKCSSAVVTIEASEDNAFAEVATELREPIYVKDTTLDQLKHCTVSLVPFEDTKNMAVWCMVHELYKCFCGGRATDGKPLFIEKEEVNTTVGDAKSTVDADYIILPAPKARYSFEKLEEEHKEEKSDEPEEFILPEEYLPSNAEQHIDDEEQEDDEEEEEQQPNHFIDEESEESSSADDDTIVDPDVNLFKRKRGRPAKLTATLNKNNSHKRGRPFTLDILHDYFNANTNTCRRAVAVPAKIYARLNRKRLPKICDYINANENSKTRLLLNEHILRSVYYHKHELEKQRKVECETSITQKPEKADDTSRVKTAVKTEVQSVELFDEDPHQSSVACSSTSSKQSKSSKRFKKRKRCNSSQTEIFKDESQVKDNIKRHRGRKRDNNGRFNSIPIKSTKSDDLEATTSLSKSINFSLPREQKLEEDTTATTSSALLLTEKPHSSNIDTTTIQVPKISGCFSLNDNEKNVDNQLQDVISDSPTPSSSQNSSVTADITSATNDVASTQSTARALGLEDVSISNENFKEFYNGVIKNMNNLVSKKMQDIDMALKRESKVIPAPNNDILCIIKWSNFLDAFNQGFVFIWEVKMKDHSFFAATISNMMPMILGAMGVVNIAAMDAKKMPLMGRMLVEGHRSEKTWKLAIVMQGRTKYWLVKGFLRPDISSACAKPNPQTHPVLTRKINVLCGLLIQQRIKEYHRKIQQRQDENAARLMQNRPLIARSIPPLVAPVSPTIRQHSQISGKSTSTAPTLVPSSKKQIAINQECLNIEPLSKLFKQQPISPTIRQHSAPTLVPSTKKQIAINQECLNNEHLSQRFKQQQQPPPIPQQLVPPTIPTTTVSEESATVVAALRSQKSKKLSAFQPSFPSNMAASTSNSSPSNASLLRDLTAQSGYANMKTNIEFRKVNKDDIKEIFQPEIHLNDHRWLVLDLYNDFSHIFVPDFQDLVSLDRIHKVMAFSRLKEKIVKLQFFQNAPFDAFVTPSSLRKIYFGPLKLNMRPPLLILLQSVDGKMMCREIYQQQHNIPRKPNECTTAFWILQIDGQTHFEIEDMEVADVSTIPTPTLVPIRALPQQHMQPSSIVDPDSDEDCMIVEDEETTSPPERRSSEDLGQLLPNSEETTIEEAVSPSGSSIETYGNDFPSQIINAYNEPKPTSAQRISFTIQSNANATGLQITPISSIENTGIHPLETPNAGQFTQPLAATALQSGSILQLPPPNVSQHAGFLPLINLPTSAVITSTELAPKDAPYGSTIYISNVQSVGTTLEQSNTTVKPITIFSNDLGTVTTPAIQTPILNSLIQKQPLTLTSAAEHSSVSIPSAKIKQRRVSLRCPSQANKEATNIAIDAVLKLMPPQPQEQPAKVVVVGEEQEKVASLEVSPELPAQVAALLPTKSTAAAAISPPYQNFNNSNISTIGCTTITKLLDNTAMPGRTVQTAKMTALLGMGAETSKSAANITVEPIIDIDHSNSEIFLNEITGEVEVLTQTPTTTTTTTSTTEGGSNLQEASPPPPPVMNKKSTHLLMADSSANVAPSKSKRRRLTTGRISIGGSSDSESSTKNVTTLADTNTSTTSLSSSSNAIKFPLTIPTKFNVIHARKDPHKIEPSLPPMVFDVNFMDSADEPAASILIKQTSPLNSSEIRPLSLPACTTITAKPTTTMAVTTTTPTSITTNTLAVDALSQLTSATMSWPAKRTVTSAVKLPASALRVLQTMPPSVSGSGGLASATSLPVTSLNEGKKLASTSVLNGPHQKKVAAAPSTATRKTYATMSALQKIAPKLSTTSVTSVTTAAATQSTQTAIPSQILNFTFPPATAPLLLSTTQQLKMATVDAPTLTPNPKQQQQQQRKMAIMDTPKVGGGVGSRLQQRSSLPSAVEISTSATLNTSASNFKPSASQSMPILNVRPSVPPFSVPVKLNLNQKRLNETTIKVVKTTAAKSSTTTSTTTIAASGSAATPTESAEYGHFICRLPDAPKFVGKRVRDDFLMKVPEIGIVRFTGGKFGAINTYLNQHMLSKNPNFKSVDWNFITQKGFKLPVAGAASKDPGDDDGGVQIVNKVTMRRKLKGSSNGAKSGATTSAKAVANATAAASTNVHSDTILIDD